MHWQNNNTINECIIILLDIHWWSKRDGKAWLLRAIFSLSLLSEGNPLFVSTAIIFSTPSFFIITPYSLSFLDPTVFPNSPLFSPPALFTFAQGDEDIPVRVDRNLGMMCVCACLCLSALVCFMTLSSVDEREEVSSVIYSDQPSCPICVSLHRFALSHTHLPSLSHFTVSLLRSPCTSSSTSTYLSFSDNSSPYIALLSQYQATRNLWSVGWHSLYPHIDTRGAAHKYTQLKTTRSKPVNS